MQPITMSEVLTLFDRFTGYGIDSHSRNELEQLHETNRGKHVTDRRTAYSIIQDYIQTHYAEINKKPPRTERQRNTVVLMDGDFPTAKFNKPDILRMLENKTVQRALAQQFKKNTEVVSGFYVPAIVAATHPQHPDNQETELEPWENWI